MAEAAYAEGPWSDPGGAAFSSKLSIELDSVPTSAVASVLGKKPQSLSPARDSLMKKGLVYSSERGQIAFTVPHFGRYLRTHPD